MADAERPSFIQHWREVEGPEENHYRGDDEPLGFGAPLARQFGLTRIGIHHERLPPGRRSSFPHAEMLEEEFVYVLEGNPDVWLDGELYPLRTGDSVGFPAGTGITHTFINNTSEEVRLLVVGEASRPDNRIFYPKNLDMKEKRSDWWENPPPMPLGRPAGNHDGLPDAVRNGRAAKER